MLSGLSHRDRVVAAAMHWPYSNQIILFPILFFTLP